jgi:hypothetical protein
MYFFNNKYKNLIIKIYNKNENDNINIIININNKKYK